MGWAIHAIFAGYFMRPLLHPLRINAETRPGSQVHSRLVASAVDSALIQAVFSASSPANEKAFRFLNIFQLKSRSFVTLGPSLAAALHLAPSIPRHVSLPLPFFLSFLLSPRPRALPLPLISSFPSATLRFLVLSLLLFTFHQRSRDPFSRTAVQSAIIRSLSAPRPPVSPAITPPLFSSPKN